MAFALHLQEHSIHLNDSIDGLKRPALPFQGPLYDFVCNGVHSIRRDILVIEILDMSLNIPGGHPLEVH